MWRQLAPSDIVPQKFYKIHNFDKKISQGRLWPERRVCTLFTSKAALLYTRYASHFFQHPGDCGYVAFQVLALAELACDIAFEHLPLFGVFGN